MVAAFYFLILTGQRLEIREQIFILSPVISVFPFPVQWEQGTAQLLGCQLRLRATPQVSPRFGLGSWEGCGAKAVLWPHVPGFEILPVHVFQATRRERRATQY